MDDLVNRRETQRGVALALVLWMLVLLGLLGSLALSLSGSEIRVAANDRNSQAALLAADAGIRYAQTDATIYTTIGTGGGGAPPGTVTRASIAVGNNTAQNVSVTYLTVGPPPVGSGVSTDYLSQYFSLQSTGVGPNNAQALIEGQSAKIIPKP